MQNKLKSKLIYAKTRDAFKREYDAGNITPNLNPLVFIEDTKEFWIRDNFYSIASPTIEVTESDDIVNVHIGEGKFRLSPGSNITIRKSLGSANDIIISSSALSSIDTEYPLYWDRETNKLTHTSTLDIEEDQSIGPESDASNASYITVPSFTVNKYGHITEASHHTIQIRDYVTQRPTTTNDRGDHNILISGTTDEGLIEASETKKALGLYFNPQTKKLTIEGGFESQGPSTIDGGLEVTGGMIKGTVEGDITGTATPKIHTSKDPEYGGASKNLYGHVKLEDELGISAPPPSSDETEESADNTIRGVAASPRMVWNEKEKLNRKIDDLPIIQKVNVGKDSINTSELENGVLGVRIEGGLHGGIDPETNELYVQSVEITGYDETNTKQNINNKLEFTEDFEIEDEKLSIRWTNIPE